MSKKTSHRSKAAASVLLKPNDNSPYVVQRDKIKIDLNIRELPWTEKQKSIIDLFLNKHTKALFLKGPAGTSKAQPLTSKVLTPQGWVTMGEIKPGDYVMTPYNTAAQVESIHPQGVKDIYRITFSDKSTADCTYDHLWFTTTANERQHKTRKGNIKTKTPLDGKVRTTEEIHSTLFQNTVYKKHNHAVPLVEPLDFNPHVELPIDPYLLGALLGDGGITQNQLIFSSKDPEIIERVSLCLTKHNHTLKKVPSSNCDYRINSPERNEYRLTYILNELGLMGCSSLQKFIPSSYLWTSAKNRLDILRGLMDTDGFISSKQKATCFTTISPQLAEGVKHIVESLGGLARITKQKAGYKKDGQYISCQDCYVVAINLCVNPFFLNRKAVLWRPNPKYKPMRFITNIEKIGEAHAQCILIDHPKHLYVTDNFIVTHNTMLAMYCGLQLLNMRKVSDIVLVRSAVESSDSKMGYLPGTLDEKFDVYLTPFNDKFEELLSKSQIAGLESDNRLVMCPINFARGLHFAAKFVCCDESQNLSTRELQTFLSRIGEFCKVMICGDPDQSDLPKGKSGFNEVYQAFDNPESEEQGIYCVELTEDDIVRSEFCKYITKVFKGIENSKK